MDAPHWTGSDDRDLDEREPAPCPDCGVDADTPCTPECGCVNCRRTDWAQQDAAPKEVASMQCFALAPNVYACRSTGETRPVPRARRHSWWCFKCRKRYLHKRM